MNYFQGGPRWGPRADIDTEMLGEPKKAYKERKAEKQSGKKEAQRSLPIQSSTDWQ